MFETFNVLATYFMNSGLLDLSLYSAGRMTAGIVNIGHSVCSVVSAYEGYFLLHASFQLNIGGLQTT